MNVFGIGLPEMVLILALALLIFGPKKLPEIGRSLGKALKGFQDASKEFETEFKREAERIEKVVTEPMKATIEPPAVLKAAETNSSGLEPDDVIEPESTVAETSPPAPVADS